VIHPQAHPCCGPIHLPRVLSRGQAGYPWDGLPRGIAAEAAFACRIRFRSVVSAELPRRVTATACRLCAARDGLTQTVPIRVVRLLDAVIATTSLTQSHSA